MIGRLRGQILEVDGATVLIDVHGVGYEVMVPELVLMRLPAPGEAKGVRSSSPPARREAVADVVCIRRKRPPCIDFAESEL